MARLAARVPGVSFEPRPREPELPFVRTDVAGFIGFEPRVRAGTGACRLIGSPLPVGHRFTVEVVSFQLVVNGTRATVSETPELILSEDDAAIPILPGQAIAYAIVAVLKDQALRLVVLPGGVAATGFEQPPDDSQVKAAVDLVVAPGMPWVRIVNVSVRREADVVWPVILPALPPTRCDDWNDYLLQLGTPPTDGSLLGPSARAYFANGGRRCYIATVSRPLFTDTSGLERSRAEMVGVAGSSELEATGLERLLLIDEVSLIDVPDLYARRLDAPIQVVNLPGRVRESCFVPCETLLGPVGPVPFAGEGEAGDPLYPSNDKPALDPTYLTQKQMIARCLDERWRVMLILSVPLMPDGARFSPPSDVFAATWRDRFDQLVKSGGFADDPEMSVAALYWPWVLSQEKVGADVVPVPPGPFVVGVMARRDLARGPQVAPANETVKGVVGLTWPIDDATHGGLYQPAPDVNGLDVPAVNVLRAFPGYGVQVWGARTLSTDTWMRFVSVRRCLSSIERRMKVALDTIAFEPNTPMLWLQVTQLGLSVLLPVFESGALRGDQPEQAFYIRCDSTVNPPENVQVGQLLCEVGVAIAAPAEFLVFRIGRREGVVEVTEAS